VEGEKGVPSLLWGRDRNRKKEEGWGKEGPVRGGRGHQGVGL
jgi:hypothetical protein